MRRLILFPLFLAFAGCGLLSPPQPQPLTLYQLTPAKPAASTAQPSPLAASAAACNKVLRVRSVEANPPYAGNALRYSETPQVLGSFAWHRWATPPATMLTGDILKTISASSLYRAVLGPTDPGAADLTLAVRIDRGPVQIFSASNVKQHSSVEHFSYTATLANATDGAVLGVHTFSAEHAAAPDPYGGVKAANAITAQLDGELLVWLRHLNQHACR